MLRLKQLTSYRSAVTLSSRLLLNQQDKLLLPASIPARFTSNRFLDFYQLGNKDAIEKERIGDKKYEEMYKLERRRLEEMLKLDPDQFIEFLAQESQRFRMENQQRRQAFAELWKQKIEAHLIKETGEKTPLDLDARSLLQEKPEELMLKRKHHPQHEGRKGFQVLDYFFWSRNRPKTLKVD